MNAGGGAGSGVGLAGTVGAQPAAAAGASGRLSHWLAQLRSGQGPARLWAMLGGSALIAVVAAALLWARAPDWGVLYTNLSDRDGGAIIGQLAQLNVPYKFTGGGSTLMVEAAKVPELRLKLAAQGLPRGGNVGFELMDGQKFGTSQFAEQVNYQRALEGELARSIGSIGAVESARVHLALPKPSLFVREQKKPSASVVLQLRAGRSLDEAQVSAIAHLVSSSVPDLSTRSISVVDQSGRLLSAPESQARGLDVGQLRYAQELEAQLQRRIESILQPLLGAGNVHAQVTADIDFSVVENTEESYRPNQEPGQAAIRSQQTSENNQGASGASGVPGALSNQPPADPASPVVGGPGARNDAGSRTGGASGRKDATVNFELDRNIRHTQTGAGALRRLTAAVVVNHRTGPKGQPQPIPAAELEQIRNLVKEAMGFKAERGDSMSVAHSAFVREDSDRVAPPAWRDPEYLALARAALPWLAGLAVLLFGWLAIGRPLLRRHLQPPAAPPLVTGTPLAENLAPADAPTQDHLPLQRHQDNLRYAQGLAGDDPRMVAMLINDWMDKE